MKTPAIVKMLVFAMPYERPMGDDTVLNYSRNKLGLKVSYAPGSTKVMKGMDFDIVVTKKNLTAYV